MEKSEENNSETSFCSGGVTLVAKRSHYYIKLSMLGFVWNQIEMYTRHRKFRTDEFEKRTGEVVLITGGNRGIGLEVVKKLLQLDMQVIIAVRNTEKCEIAIANARNEGISLGKTTVYELDLCSFKSVRKFAETIKKNHSKIHVLINNAGVLNLPFKLTEDGHERQFQTNYLSHFLLTQLLLPILIATGTPEKASRIVNVSSIAAYGVRANFDDLDGLKLRSPQFAYMQSKLLQVISTYDLNSQLMLQFANVKVFAVHPGVVKTDIYEHTGLVNLFGCIFYRTFKSAVKGADPVMYVAISPEAEKAGCFFFGNSKLMSLPSQVKNKEVQIKLRNISCELTGIKKLDVRED